MASNVAYIVSHRLCNRVINFSTVFIGHLGGGLFVIQLATPLSSFLRYMGSYVTIHI